MNSDYLIIGGGSAGAVLAARLSENGRHRVTLVEAGDDTPPDATPADIDDTFPSSSTNPAYFWPGLQATTVRGRPPHPYPQARVMGGGSSIMGMIALRGLPSDYARWVEAGAAGCGWNQVLPYFRKLEGRGDGARPPGPYPIRYTPRDEWPPFVEALRGAAARQGLADVADANESGDDGFFTMPVSRDAHARSSSARCYLTRDVRARGNLRILPNTFVKRIRFEGRVAIGVEVERHGEAVTLDARHTIVSAGGIHSPTILLRSGVGPAADLARLGIQSVADLPGVGRNLQNHAYSLIALTLPAGLRLSERQRLFAVAGLRASSGLADCPRGDLLLSVLGRVSARAFGTDVAMLSCALYSPESRGAVTLASADPQVSPRVDFGMLSDPRDPPRVVAALRLAESLLRDPSVASLYGEASLLPAGLALQQFNQRGWRGALMASAAKLVLGGPAPLRRAAMKMAVPGALALSDARGVSRLSNEDLLASIAAMGHPVGSCRMGVAADPLAVVDSRYRVHGLSGLSVVDASIMPVIPAANTNLPTMMLAEHAADRL